jgi:hypothetical protein
MTTFDYTSRDYYSIREDLLTRAAAMPIGTDWTTRSTSDFGVMLVELWAYMGDVLHFYVDRAAAEAYIGTATQRESVMALANLLDYEALPLHPATASITIVPATGATGTITVPYGTGFVAPARNTSEYTVYFVSTQSASMNASGPSMVVPVTEGLYIQDEQPVNMLTSNGNTSTGSPNQKFSLRNSNVVPSTVAVSVYEGPLVDGEPTAVQYRYVPRLLDIDSSDKAFTVLTSADNVSQIVFGNGINGKIPAKDAKVTCNYIKSMGANGNVAANRITSFYNGTIANAVISSSTAATGGYDNESIDSLKANVPLLFRTQDRAVSLQDFKDLSLRIPGVVKATASNSGSDVTIYPIGYQTDYLLPSFGSTITIDSTIASSTISYFEPRTTLGASVGVAPSISLTQVHVKADVHVRDGYVQRWITDKVTNAFDEFFKFENVSFGQTLSLGELYRAAMNVEGVDYVNITVFNTSSTGIASGNKISAGATSLIHKAAAYVLTPYGGVTG